MEEENVIGKQRDDDNINDPVDHRLPQVPFDRVPEIVPQEYTLSAEQVPKYVGRADTGNAECEKDQRGQREKDVIDRRKDRDLRLSAEDGEERGNRR